MASRTPSLNDRSDVAVSREIDSKYDDVKKVADAIDEVVLVAGNLSLLTEVNDARTELLGLLDVLGIKTEILAVYGISTEIVSLVGDKVTLDSLYADKVKLDSLFADKAVLDSLYADKTTLDALYASKAQFDIVIANLADITVVGDNIVSVVSVADSIVNVNTLVPNLGNVDTVALNMLDVNAVAENVYNTGVVARNIADINTVVTDVVPNMAEVLLVDDRAAQVAQDKFDVTNMKEAVYNTFYDFHVRYLGSHSVDPITSYWGDPLIDGAMYFDTNISALKVYDKVDDRWITVPPLYLSGLRDVKLASIGNGDILVWNGVDWVNTVLSKAMVGLGNVDNTSDADKIVASAGKLTIPVNISLSGDASGSVSFDGSANTDIVITVGNDTHAHAFNNLTGIPTTLAGYGITDADTSAQITTKINNEVSTAVSGLVNSAPTLLDTLDELAAALGDDPNFATTVANNIATKVTKNADIVAGTGTKITYDTKGLVTGSTTLNASDIPSLDASKITSGTLSVDTSGNAATATRVNNTEVIKFDTGVTEGTDLYTFDGSVSKTINIKAGTNVTLTKAAGSVTINANDTSIAVTEITGMGAGASTFLATPTSTNLAEMLTDETGTGAVVFADSPTLTGTPLATTAVVGTNTTQVATTAYVIAEINKVEEW